MKLVIPGKTFLVGEYSVLVGGRALGVATHPCFEQDLMHSNKITIHEKSAAGLFLKSTGQSVLEISAWSSTSSVGGFGRSTAEFIAAWFDHHHVYQKDNLFDLKDIFHDYRNLYDLNSQLKQIKPSGGDLMTQLLGHVTLFDPEVAHSKSFQWIFKDLQFDIISTGIKIPTHDHLSTIDLNQLKRLCEFSEKIISAYLSVDQDAFLSGMHEWTIKLNEFGLQHNHSMEMKNLIETCSSVLVAKPNGALGADTITVIYKSENKMKVREYFKEHHLACITGSEFLTKGAHYVD